MICKNVPIIINKNPKLIIDVFIRNGVFLGQIVKIKRKYRNAIIILEVLELLVKES